MNIYRNAYTQKLNAMAEYLRSKGFWVSAVIEPENPYTDGVAYFHTDATNFDILNAWRSVDTMLAN